MPELVAALALAAAFAMGFAIQRGGTCMVVAVDQVVSERRGWKLLALVECGLLATLLMALGERAGVHFKPGDDYPVGAALVIGAVMLGTGAWLNGACLMGTVARIGSRQWAWLLTPAGFLLGCFAARWASLQAGAAMMVRMGLTATMLAGFALVLFAGVARRSQPWRELGNTPSDLRFTRALHAIGALSVALTVLAGPWAWSDTVARLARGEMAGGLLGALLVGTLLAGALIAGRSGPGQVEAGAVRWPALRAER